MRVKEWPKKGQGMAKGGSGHAQGGVKEGSRRDQCGVTAVSMKGQRQAKEGPHRGQGGVKQGATKGQCCSQRGVKEGPRKGKSRVKTVPKRGQRGDMVGGGGVKEGSRRVTAGSRMVIDRSMKVHRCAPDCPWFHRPI